MKEKLEKLKGGLLEVIKFMKEDKGEEAVTKLEEISETLIESEKEELEKESEIKKKLEKTASKDDLEEINKTENKDVFAGILY